MSKSVKKAFERICNEEISKLPKGATKKNRAELAESLAKAFSAMSGRAMFLSERKKLAKRMGVEVNIVSSRFLTSEMNIVQLEGALSDGTEYATVAFEKLTEKISNLEKLFEKQRRKKVRTRKELRKIRTNLALQLFATKESTGRADKAMEEINKLKAEKRPIKKDYKETFAAIEKALTEPFLANTCGQKK